MITSGTWLGLFGPYVYGSRLRSTVRVYTPSYLPNLITDDWTPQQQKNQDMEVLVVGVVPVLRWAKAQRYRIGGRPPPKSTSRGGRPKSNYECREAEGRPKYK